MNYTTIAKDYRSLIHQITELTFKNSNSKVNIVHDKGKNMLKRLFPNWLLQQYKWMFAAPFPHFSAWMNAWVTHFTTNWLMGNSTVLDLELENGEILKDQLVLVEKCRFLETAGCVSTCLNACKIPTQRFFLEEMGVPVTLNPNITDKSCRFEFGMLPPSVENDPVFNMSCYASCSNKFKYSTHLSDATSPVTNLNELKSKAASACVSLKYLMKEK
jgi:hypothetical protein